MYMENNQLISEIEKLSSYQKEITQLVADYATVVVTENNLPDIQIAYGTVHSKRMELVDIRKDGTSRFERNKKQFQDNCDALIGKITPVENNLKSSINAFEDDDAWEKAVKGGTVKDLNTYLNKFDNSKFDYKGKHVTEAKMKIEAYETKKRNQLQNYTNFVQKCNQLQLYKTTDSARAGKKALFEMDMKPDLFGDHLADAYNQRSTTLQAFDQRIEELEQLEAAQAEAKRIAEEQLKIREEQEAERKRLKDENDRLIAAQEAEARRIEAEKKEQEAQERQRIEEIERQKKELENLKQQAEEAEERARRAKEENQRIEAEKQRKENLRKEGKIEIDGTVYGVSTLNEIAVYNRTTLENIETEKASEIDRLYFEMLEGQKAGKNFYNDLTTVQRSQKTQREKGLKFAAEKIADCISELDTPLIQYLLANNIVNNHELVTIFKNAIEKILTNKQAA